MIHLFELDCAATADTENAGRTLAIMIKNTDLPRFVALSGQLGAGKTAFTRGFCSVFCPEAPVRSPSFSLVNEYHGNPDVFHFDVWRIRDDDDLYSTGYYDYQFRGGIIVCEWADNIGYALPDEYIFVSITGSGDEIRHITATVRSGENNENFIS